VCVCVCVCVFGGVMGRVGLAAQCQLRAPLVLGSKGNVQCRLGGVGLHIWLVLWGGRHVLMRTPIFWERCEQAWRLHAP
jgi:hypothetical protein